MAPRLVGGCKAVAPTVGAQLLARPERHRGHPALLIGLIVQSIHTVSFDRSAGANHRSVLFAKVGAARLAYQRLCSRRGPPWRRRSGRRSCTPPRCGASSTDASRRHRQRKRAAASAHLTRARPHRPTEQRHKRPTACALPGTSQPHAPTPWPRRADSARVPLRRCTGRRRRPSAPRRSAAGRSRR